jgi:hypothetical protein
MKKIKHAHSDTYIPKIKPEMIPDIPLDELDNYSEEYLKGMLNGLKESLSYITSEIPKRKLERYIEVYNTALNNKNFVTIN